MNNDLISREALKKELYDFLSENSTTCDWDDIFDVIDNAKTPTEGDCISRELLKKDIDAQISDFNELNKKGEPYKEFKDIRAILFGLFIGKNLIDNAPTVEPRDSFDLGYVKGLKDGKDKLIKELWNCRNELCLRCGKYEKAHRGACDDCRYNFKNMKQYKRGDDE